jgi:hypothetical protein
VGTPLGSMVVGVTVGECVGVGVGGVWVGVEVG